MSHHRWGIPTFQRDRFETLQRRSIGRPGKWLGAHSTYLAYFTISSPAVKSGGAGVRERLQQLTRSYASRASSIEECVQLKGSPMIEHRDKLNSEADMVSMNTQLPADLEQFVLAKVRRGRFTSADAKKHESSQGRRCPDIF